MATNKTINPTNQTVSIPAFTDQPDARVFSNGIDKSIDGINKNYTDIGKIQSSLAIVATGNTHVAINAGQYVYVKGHSTLNDGLYIASSNIAANATLSSSNLTADSSGGLNSLNDQIKMKFVSTSVEPFYIRKAGNSVFIKIQNFTCNTTKGWQTIGTVPSSCIPAFYFYFAVALTNTNNNFALAQVKSDGEIAVYNPNTSANIVNGSVMYMSLS